MRENSSLTGRARIDSPGAALVYALGPITGILWLLLGRNCPAIRYHSTECLAASVVSLGSFVGLTTVQYLLTFVPVIGVDISVVLGLVYPVFVAVVVVLWVRFIYHIYRGKPSRFPVAWRVADRYGTHLARIEA